MKVSTVINDPIHGSIIVPKMIKEFINVSKFQRLRRIRQLGNTHRVFPSANHTRFEHSIGVMHLAGRIAEHLKIPPEYVELIQLAGLYHDIGHLPYSHLFDRILEHHPVEGILPCHEDRSVQIFTEIATQQGLSQSSIDFVTACILGEPLDGHPKYYFQIVCGPVDADRLDYLQRDNYYVRLGRYAKEIPIDKIIKNMMIGPDGDLTFAREAYDMINGLFELRLNMHEKVYQNEKCLQYDTMYACMIADVLYDLDLNNICDYSLEAILMSSQITRDRYEKVDCGHVEHSDICRNPSHMIVKKYVSKANPIDEINWAPVYAI